MMQIIDLPIDAAPITAEPSRAQRPSDRVYVFRWDRQQRKGQHCHILVARGTMNSCLVRFDDGYTMVTSRNAIKKWQLPKDKRADVIKTRQMIAPLRNTDDPRAPAAKVIVQSLDEALQTPGALADVLSIMKDNRKRIADPTLDAVSLEMMSPGDIARLIVPDPDDGAR